MPIDPGQRARDARLAWIIVGCSAAATVALVIGALFALRAPLAGLTATMAAGNSSAPAPDRSDEIGKSPPRTDDTETNLAGEVAADPPAAELHKRGAERQPPPDEGDAASVRRGHSPREQREPPPDRPTGPIA